MTKFGAGLLGKKTQDDEPEKPPVKIADSQLIKDIEDIETFNNFCNALSQINKQKQEIAKSQSTPEDNLESIENPIKKCHNQTLQLLGEDFDQNLVIEKSIPDILSLANTADTYKKVVSDYKNELETSKKEHLNAQQSKIVPSSFIKRITGKIETQAIDISEQLSSYESYYQTTDDFDSFDSLVDFLSEDYDAVIRTSTLVSDLSKLRDELRHKSMTKFKLEDNQMTILESNEEISTSNLILSQIKNQYKEFEEEQKKKNQKRTENTNLFGMTLNQPVAAKRTFAFGQKK